MVIEFRCTSCQSLLRTGDDTAGKKAKCPQCGSIVPIPAATPVGGEPPSGGPPLPPPVPPPPPRFETDNPFQSPQDYHPALDAETAGGGASPIVHTRIDVGDVLSRAWRIFRAQMMLAIVGVFAVTILQQGAGFAVQMVTNLFAVAVGDPLVAGAVGMVAMVASWVISLWLGLGMTAYLLKIGRGIEPKFSDLFAGGKHLGAALLATIVFVLCLLPATLVVAIAAGVTAAAAGPDSPAFIVVIIVGVLLAAVPTIYLSLAFSQFQNLIVDRDLGAIDALRMSFRITTGNKLSIFVLGIVIALANLLGLLACCVGVFIALPFGFVTYTVAYLAMTGQTTGESYLAQQASGAAQPA